MIDLTGQLVKSMKIAFRRASLGDVAVTLEGLVLSKMNLPGVAGIIGEIGMRRCTDANVGSIESFAWALAAARDGLQPEAFHEILGGLSRAMPALGDERRRLLAWACAEVGLSL